MRRSLHSGVKIYSRAVLRYCSPTPTIFVAAGPGDLREICRHPWVLNWPRAVLTDSGGYQIFSLPGSRTLCEEYAEFTSYTDSALIRLSPERSIEAQKIIGADIMMALDQCVPSTVEHEAARNRHAADA